MATSTKRGRVSATTDLRRLEEIADALDALNGLYEERREIWLRRYIAQDTSQSELARRSRTSRAVVNQALLSAREGANAD